MSEAQYCVLCDISRIGILSKANMQNFSEGLITEEECLDALKTFQKIKTPGTDGFLPPILERNFQPFVHCFNEAVGLGELSISQKQGIIKLLPFKNRRHISLLNTDYKIATKCTARRLEKVIPHLTAIDQTGYIKGRLIGENVKLILDVLEQCDTPNKEGIFLDSERAFGSLVRSTNEISTLYGTWRNEFWTTFSKLDL